MNMQEARIYSGFYASLKKIIAVALALFVAMGVCAPAAMAMSVEKCTARTNSDTGNDVMGATETRITWEGQAAKKEAVQSITLTMPQGTTFETEDSRLTVLSGADLMTRENPDVTFSQEGQSIVATLAQPASAGAYFRVEVYGVNFPAEGGKEVLTGSYTTADGTSHDMAKIPAIKVKGITKTEQLSNWLGEQDWVQSWNSNKFLHLFLDPTLLVTSFPSVVKGFFMAVAIVLVSFPLAIPVGLVLSLMRMSKSRILRAIASVYVNVVRGTPVFLQIYIAFFGLPLAGIQIPNFPLGVIVLALNSSAYQCEIFRAGIQSINKGQFEASRSLGMNAAQTMLFVIIPQTIRRVIPTMTSEFILLYKDTSLLAAVGVMEIVMYAKSIVASTGSITPYIVAACFYLVVTLPLAKVVGILETKLDMDSKQGPATKKKRKARGELLEGGQAPAGEIETVDAAASAGGPVVYAASDDERSVR